jgi:RIO kinase 2
MHLHPRQSQSHRQSKERFMYDHLPLLTSHPKTQPLIPFALDDGYRLTYGGLDYLSLHTHLKRQTLYSTGNQIGVGKESDIFVVASPSGTQHVLKIHRLGRISFRTIKNNRDYLRHRSSASWMYMSRLAALKEFAFMKALRENGFRVPEPIANSRHTIVMELIDAFPLRQISKVPDPAGLYTELIEMILRLAEYGLIHGDFNEFNILIKEDEVPSAEPIEKEENPTSSIRLTPVLIDFPQMVSIDHANAEMYFDRDVNCIKRFFARRFHFTSDEPGPFFAEAKKWVGRVGGKRLDVEVEASGFSRKMAKDLEKYMQEFGADGDGGNGRDEEDTLDDVDAGEEEREEGVETHSGASQDSNHSGNIRNIGEEGKVSNTREQLSVPISEVSSMSLGDT